MSELGQASRTPPGAPPADDLETTDLSAAVDPRDVRAEEVRKFALFSGENKEWLECHEAEVLSRHPEWAGGYVVVASRTSSKVVAASPRRTSALEEALKSPEVEELALREGVKPGSVITAFVTGTARWFLE